ncbi:phosphatase 2C-like domain-containing protein [Lobosporangium transversale]|uniref:Protein phosphatase n=1 Tax=Lobosporangium transversale TaxID=64571 RepID=A0A1Y2GLM9_9FUNG|nr:phosphatase 2C-like domain-containing protein [Lobosporangium transversale]ORZ14408.1 phosphatase 2C-like domain-containing protein [Lobosporangium transversale]|eukprot:XP_021880886.1 phosphatase 2C-like domain-containing protein [Lobosporangium transversale]
MSSFFDQPFQKTRHNYVFAHGASGFAKNPGKAPVLTPEEDRAYFSVQVGEDSYFRRHDALGVADGVGGWSGTTGANPALYSRKLMHYAYLELEKYDNIEEEAFYDYFNANPVDILEKSFEQSTRDAKKEGLIGSSTACIVILRDDELRIANLGDCGVSVIRRNEFIFRTEEQQHSFNYPYQLGTGSTDSPRDAQMFTVKVESGDIVVMGTDGIFDNLFDEDILEEVVKCVSEPSVISDALAKRAKSVAEDTRHHGSPFQSRAMQEGLYYQGGKQDDMSVLVAIIKAAEDSPDRR